MLPAKSGSSVVSLPVENDEPLNVNIHNNRL